MCTLTLVISATAILQFVIVVLVVLSACGGGGAVLNGGGGGGGAVCWWWVVLVAVGSSDLQLLFVLGAVVNRIAIFHPLPIRFQSGEDGSI